MFKAKFKACLGDAMRWLYIEFENYMHGSEQLNILEYNAGRLRLRGKRGNLLLANCVVKFIGPPITLLRCSLASFVQCRTV
jgi:hypothetical protein